MASVKRYYNKEGEAISIQIRVYRGEDANGKTLPPYQKSVKLPKGATERQIQKIEQRESVMFENACKNGDYNNDKILFRDFAKQVMEIKAISGVAESTLFRYQHILDTRLLPYFGHKKVRDINGSMLNLFYKEMLSEGKNRRTGGALSPKTVLEYHRLLSTIFVQARKQHIVTHNPAEDATPPKAVRKIPNYFQPEQLAKIQDAFNQQPIFWRLMGYLLMFYGDRRSEFAGIRYDDVDFARHTITLRGSVLYTPRRGVYSKETLKNGKGRELPMPALIEKMVQEYLVWRTEEKEKCGADWQESGYLFTDSRGGMMNPDNITQYLARLTERMQKSDPEFPHLNAHAFRHTVVSSLLYQGLDVVSVAAFVGDDPATITAHYAHIINKGTLRAAETMGKLISAG